MTKQEFDRIKADAAAWAAPPLPGEPSVLVVCGNGQGKIIHPDSLGPELAAAFKARVQALHQAVRDRDALVKFIVDGFDVEWPEEKGA